MSEVGALARFFSGWTRQDLISMPVRERRYWVEWANAYIERQSREAARQRELLQMQQMTQQIRMR